MLTITATAQHNVFLPPALGPVQTLAELPTQLLRCNGASSGRCAPLGMTARRFGARRGGANSSETGGRGRGGSSGRCWRELSVSFQSTSPTYCCTAASNCTRADNAPTEARNNGRQTKRDLAHEPNANKPDKESAGHTLGMRHSSDSSLRMHRGGFSISSRHSELSENWMCENLISSCRYWGHGGDTVTR